MLGRVRRLKSMRRGEYSSRHGVLVVLLLFLLGASLLLSVPMTTDANPITQKPESTTNSMFEPILGEYSERDWDFVSRESKERFQLLRSNSESQIDVPDLDSWQVLDVMPFGTPHVPIIIDDNSDFETQGWPGEGTVEQPYLIAGLNINATTGVSAINITNTDVDFFIMDCWLTSNSTDVIELSSVTHARITNNTILQGERGVAAFHCSDLTIYDNLFYSFGWAGVYMEDCSLSRLSNNNCTNCFVGLHIEQSNNILVEDNFCTGCLGGIAIYLECEEITVFNNTLTDNDIGIGLYLDCTNNLIDSNNCTENLVYGIYSQGCQDNEILRNFGRGQIGDIVLENCTSHTISGNDGGETTGAGPDMVASISLYNSNNSFITNNHVFNAFLCIEVANGSSYNVIADNDCLFYVGGIVTWNGAPHNTITNNTCDGGWWGEADIFVQDSSYCTVTENRCNRSMLNIGSFESNHTTVVDNECFESAYAGIGLDGNYHTMVEGNILGNGSTGIVALSQVYATIKDNTISNFTGTYSPLTGIHLESVYNSSIEGNHITECNVALWMSQSRNCSIRDNTCVDNFDGIVLVATNYDITIDDNFCHLQEGYAIVVVESFNCSVVRNTCTNTSGSEGICLLLGDADVDVSWNSFSLSTGGMDVQGNDGVITHNIIEDNELFGMTVSGIIGPNVTWNIFDHTGVNAIDDSGGTFFDYNYWFNYTGFDANGDGIGDTWHPVDGTASNNDKHPLFYQWTLPNWVEDPTNQEVELGQTFSYSLSTIVLPELAPLMDWWISDTTNFQVDNGTVTNVVDLDFATYELELRAINLYGFELSGTFTVTVVDTTMPTISGPDDLRFTLGATGHDIYWTLYDAGPDRFRISIEGVPVISGNWVSSGQIVQLNVDHLDVGVYTVVITITDVGGNIESDTVHVIVEAAPSDRIPIVPVLGLGGAAIAAIIIVVILRKKGTGE